MFVIVDFTHSRQFFHRQPSFTYSLLSSLANKLAKRSNHLRVHALRLDPNTLDAPLNIDDGLLAVVFRVVARRGVRACL